MYLLLTKYLLVSVILYVIYFLICRLRHILFSLKQLILKMLPSKNLNVFMLLYKLCEVLFNCDTN